MFLGTTIIVYSYVDKNKDQISAIILLLVKMGRCTLLLGVPIRSSLFFRLPYSLLGVRTYAQGCLYLLFLLGLSLGRNLTARAIWVMECVPANKLEIWGNCCGFYPSIGGTIVYSHLFRGLSSWYRAWSLLASWTFSPGGLFWACFSWSHPYRFRPYHSPSLRNTCEEGSMLNYLETFPLHTNSRKSSPICF